MNQIIFEIVREYVNAITALRSDETGTIAYLISDLLRGEADTDTTKIELLCLTIDINLLSRRGRLLQLGLVEAYQLFIGLDKVPPTLYLCKRRRRTIQGTYTHSAYTALKDQIKWSQFAHTVGSLRKPMIGWWELHLVRQAKRLTRHNFAPARHSSFLKPITS